jgi:ABC-type transporter Mla MlaB component
MRILIGLPVLLCMLSWASGAEIHFVKGDPSKVELVRVDDKEIVYKQGDKTITKPIKEILKVDLRDVGKLDSKATYALVELTDGSQLAAKSWLLKKKEVTVNLLAGPSLTMPVTMVANVLNNAQTETYRREWKTRVFNTRGKEAVVTDSGALPAVLGDGDETGTKISIAVTLGDEVRTVERDLSKLRGVIFKHVLDTKAPPAVCKLLDTAQDVVMVSSVLADGEKVTVTTPAGAKIEFKRDQVARLDYTKGRFEYLTDLVATIDRFDSRTREKIEKVDKDHYDKYYVFNDTNAEKQPISIDGKTYAKGVALLPTVEMTFDLKGEYREFEATVGFDDGIPVGDDEITLLIEGDNKELTKLTFSGKDKRRGKKLALNLKDVQRLKITVENFERRRPSIHLNLADAKVAKE